MQTKHQPVCRWDMYDLAAAMTQKNAAAIEKALKRINEGRIAEGCTPRPVTTTVKQAV